MGTAHVPPTGVPPHYAHTSAGWQPGAHHVVNTPQFPHSPMPLQHGYAGSGSYSTASFVPPIFGHQQLYGLPHHVQQTGAVPTSGFPMMPGSMHNCTFLNKILRLKLYVGAPPLPPGPPPRGHPNNFR